MYLHDVKTDSLRNMDENSISEEFASLTDEERSRLSDIVHRGFELIFILAHEEGISMGAAMESIRCAHLNEMRRCADTIYQRHREGNIKAMSLGDIFDRFNSLERRMKRVEQNG